MEYFEGETLEERVRRHGALPLPAALEVGRQVADALRAAHGKGVLPRDVKPATLLLRPPPPVGQAARLPPPVGQAARLPSAAQASGPLALRGGGEGWQARLIDFGLALKQDWLTSTLPVQGR